MLGTDDALCRALVVFAAMLWYTRYGTAGGRKIILVLAALSVSLACAQWDLWLQDSHLLFLIPHGSHSDLEKCDCGRLRVAIGQNMVLSSVVQSTLKNAERIASPLTYLNAVIN